jgi:hypothetical protein
MAEYSITVSLGKKLFLSKTFPKLTNYFGVGLRLANGLVIKCLISYRKKGTKWGMRPGWPDEFVKKWPKR